MGLCPFTMFFRPTCTHNHPRFPFVIRDRPGNFLFMTHWAGLWIRGIRGMSWQAHYPRDLLVFRDYLLLAAMYTDSYQLCMWLICVQNGLFLPEVNVLQEPLYNSSLRCEKGLTQSGALLLSRIIIFEVCSTALIIILIIIILIIITHNTLKETVTLLCLYIGM